MFYGLLLIALGILAVPALLLAKKPEAKDILDKITPYQGWIGVVFCFWGVWGLISSVLNIGWLTSAPIWWATMAVGAFVEAALGFLLGYSLIAKYLFSKNEASKQKGELLLAKLQPLQEKLGLVAIALGIWWVIASFIFG